MTRETSDQGPIDQGQGPVREAALVAVGDELMAGLHPDLNSPEIARRLARLGVRVVDIEVVPDDEERIRAAVAAAHARAPLVIVTGGLGPTLDDVTRHGIARAFGLELEEDEGAVLGLERWFGRRGAPMPALNLRQALLPAGSTLVPNSAGTAPGFRVEDERGVVIALPGPPAEMRVVMTEEVEPWLASSGIASAALDERRFHLHGLGESTFAELAGDWMVRESELVMGCSVKKGVLSVVVRASRAGLDALERRAEEFRERFGAHIFSESDARLEFVLGDELIVSGTTITFAESCTGGLASGLLTRVPGISAVFRRGFVTYSDEAKHEALGVPAQLLERHGAVSAEVARAMAAGAARVARADLAVAITGIAGPGGGSEEKPVGLVWIGTALDGDVRAVEYRAPPGAREWIRILAVRHALFQALRRLRERAAARPRPAD